MPRKKTAHVLGEISIRPTVLGWASLSAAIAVGMAAMTTHAPFMFLLSGAMLGAAVLSIFLSHWMIAPVRLHRNVPDRAWQDQPVHMGYYLKNTRSRGTCLGLSIEEIRTRHVESAGGFCLQLPARGAFRSGGRFIPRKRGRLRLPGMRIETRYPFWLIRTRRRINERSNMVIWPRRGELKIDLLRRGAAHCSRAAPSDTKGGQDEFFGLREYRFGDDPRWIAWRRSVNGKLIVREMSKPNPDMLLVLLGASAEKAGPQGFERLLRFAATLIDQAFVREYQVGLALGDGSQRVYLRAGAGLGQMRSCLDHLALHSGTCEVQLDEMISTVGPKALNQAQVVVISTEEDVGGSSQLPLLHGRCQGLTLLTPERLDAFFADDGAGGQEVIAHAD